MAGGAPVATLVKGAHCAAAEGTHMPVGLGSSAALPGKGVVPRPGNSGSSRRLARQWTPAKPGGRRAEGQGGVSCNALPFLLDLSLAFAPGVEFFDTVHRSFDSEVVFQATLQVPAHHALACRLNAYGTPFAAPDLQAAAHELGDADMEFAACLASPPDLDEQLSVNFGRVLSMLERNNQQQQGGGSGTPAVAAARGAAAGRAQAGGAGGTPLQQVLRSTPGGTRAAPKVLVSVDDAESGAAQLQRQSSAKKQPRSLVAGYGKRALQALLGLGYLLTVLHEKGLGGRIEFSAALTAASLISPEPSNGHVRARNASSGLKGMSSVLAGLRGIQCPSLLPRNSSLGCKTGGAAALASAAAAYGSSRPGSMPGAPGDNSSSSRWPGSPLARGFRPAASFEAAWDRVLHPCSPASGGGGGALGNGRSSEAGSCASAAAAAAVTAAASPCCSSLQLQLSLSAPLRPHSSSSDSTASASKPAGTPSAAAGTPGSSRLAHRQQAPLPAGLASATRDDSSVVFVGSPVSAGGGVPLPWLLQQQRQQQLADEGLSKTQHLGSDSSSMQQAALDSAVVQQLPGSPFAAAAAADWDAAEAADAVATPPMQAATPSSTPGGNRFGLVSFCLSDQGYVTSPMCDAGAWGGGGGGSGSAAGGAAPAGPFGRNATQHRNSGGDASAAPDSSSMPGTPQRVLLPVVSMRLTCAPSWQYDAACASSAGGGAVNGLTPPLAKDAAAVRPSTPPAGAPEQRQGVHMHQPTPQDALHLMGAHQQQAEAQAASQDVTSSGGGDGTAAALSPPCSLLERPVQGLWPTMSFSLVPVRISPLPGPRSPEAAVASPGYRLSRVQ